MTILVPLEDHLLRQHLSLVEQQYDLVEALQEVLIVVAELLNLHKAIVTSQAKNASSFPYLIAKDKLTASIGGEHLEELDVLLQMLQCLQGKGCSALAS